MTFDPACAFLLDLDPSNLFELVSAPDAPEVFRCKGCQREVPRRDRRAHWGHHRKHRRTYLKARSEQVQHVTETIKAALDTGDSDRASADEPKGASANGRPGESQSPAKEEEMPSTRTSRRGQQKARSATTAPARPATPKKEEKGEKGTALEAALYKALQDQVGSFEKTPNGSNTYTRLRINGKAFAYVFPPRETSLAVKIPKQLLHVETGLPKGHPFKTTKWGLTTTARNAKDIVAVARSLKVAAAAVTPDEDAPVTAEAAAS